MRSVQGPHRFTKMIAVAAAVAGAFPLEGRAERADVSGGRFDVIELYGNLVSQFIAIRGKAAFLLDTLFELHLQLVLGRAVAACLEVSFDLTGVLFRGFFIDEIVEKPQCVSTIHF